MGLKTSTACNKCKRALVLRPCSRNQNIDSFFIHSNAKECLYFVLALEIKTLNTFFIYSNAKECLYFVLATEIEILIPFSFKYKGALALKIKTLITFFHFFSTARRWPHPCWDCWCGNNRCFKNWLNQSSKQCMTVGLRSKSKKKIISLANSHETGCLLQQSLFASR